MGVQSTIATSRRGYLSQKELADYADITIVDATEADDRISQAEELIDAYVGHQDKYIPQEIFGLVAAAGSLNFTLEQFLQNTFDVDYFKGCEVEIVGGTGEGQRRKITNSTKPGVLTIDAAWDTTPDTTSFFKIYQLGKFPRKQDTIAYSQGLPYTTYYRRIPEAVKRATAAQVEFMVAMGDEFFATDKSEMEAERIGDYSYTNRGQGVAFIHKLIAPKAKMLLKGIYNRTGTLVNDM